jgi:LPS-assembly lipoprotein
LRTALALGMTAALAGCGFALRGQANLPYKTIYLGFSGNNELGANLRRNIRYTSSTEVVDRPQNAEAQFQMMSEDRQKIILTLDGQGRVRDYELIYRVVFRVHDGKGKEFLSPTEISLRREISFNDSALMAKEAEERLIYREMQADLVQQIMRRLEAQGR